MTTVAVWLALAPIRFNDNRMPAGTLAHGVLTVALEARRGDWRPLGPQQPGVSRVIHFIK